LRLRRRSSPPQLGKAITGTYLRAALTAINRLHQKMAEASGVKG
jgi:hypothetical protein